MESKREQNCSAPEARLLEAQIEKCLLESEKLKQELARPATKSSFPDRMARHGTWITMLLAVLGFFFGVWQYADQQRKNREAAALQAARELENRDRDFMKPLWERQLALYFEAAGAAAVLAVTTNPATRAEAEEKFMSLYYGPLTVIETPQVSGAMRAYATSLLGRDPATNNTELQRRSLVLASRIQNSLTNASTLKLIEFSKEKLHYELHR